MAAQPDDLFRFTGDLAGQIGNGQALSNEFDPGTYTISEVVPAGWTLSNIACTGAPTTITGAPGGSSTLFEPGDTTVNVQLAVGQNASCTFTDSRTASITIVKKSFGGDGAFSFDGTQAFQIVTSAGTGQNTSAFASVSPGQYVLHELVPNGWHLTALTCNNASGTSMTTATANVNVTAGEQVTCTFTDTRDGTLTITKRLSGDQTTPFTFRVPTTLDPAGSFTLQPPINGAGASKVYSGTPPGSYTVTETVPAGWVLTAITCNDPSGDTTINFAAGSATINLASGVSVECIFDDATLGSLTISVVSTGGTDTFGFTGGWLAPSSFSLTTPADGVKASRTFTSVSAGTYVVAGLGVGGWLLNDVLCVSDSGETFWSVSGAVATITYPHGENIECTYYYSHSATPPVIPPPGEETAIPALDPFVLAVLALLLGVLGAQALRARTRRYR